MTPEEVDRLEMMHKYVLSNAHFYCETVDISRPFPSSKAVEEPSWEFVWNRWLSAALRAVGLNKQCPNLIQARAVFYIVDFLLGCLSCLHHAPALKFLVTQVLTHSPIVPLLNT